MLFKVISLTNKLTYNSADADHIQIPIHVSKVSSIQNLFIQMQLFKKLNFGAYSFDILKPYHRKAPKQYVL